MIDATFSDLLNIRRLGSGRVMFACSQFLGLLDDWEESDTPPTGDEVAAVAKLRARAAATRDRAEAALRLERERQTLLAAPASLKVPALRPTDALADRLLGSAHRTMKQTLRDFEPEHPRHVAASDLLGRFFPKSARAITTLHAVEQLARMEAIIVDSATPALRAHLQTLGLSDLFDKLAEVTRDYALALQPLPTKQAISGALVIDALREANGHLCRVVSVILGHLDGDDQAERRRALLAPILHQHDAAKRARKAHGADIDVDPTTGQDLPATSSTP
jgi:hypothetical protein